MTEYQNKIYDPEAQAGYFSTVSIDGHTDRLAVLGGCGPFITSNWHLSSMRAISVLQFLVGQGLDVKRMSATGYGSTRPVSTDLSLNRRVEITLVYSPEEVRKVVGEYWAKANAVAVYRFNDRVGQSTNTDSDVAQPLTIHSPDKRATDFGARSVLSKR